MNAAARGLSNPFRWITLAAGTLFCYCVRPEWSLAHIMLVAFVLNIAITGAIWSREFDTELRGESK